MDTNLQGLYKGILLDHARRPRGRGRPDGATLVRHGRNTLCGDDVELAVVLAGGMLVRVEFQGRGCAVCTASASMLTEAVRGLTCAAAADLYRRLARWLSGQEQSDDFPGPLRALAVVRSYPARVRCALLPWETLYDALAAACTTAEEDGD